MIIYCTLTSLQVANKIINTSYALTLCELAHFCYFVFSRLRYNISAALLIHMRDLGFSWMAISRMLSVNIRTLYNHRRQLGLVDYGSFTNISNNDLDHHITEVLQQTPGSGETYITGSLRGRGIRVPRWRVRERLRIIDPVGRALRGRRAIQRRVYNVSVPNQLWYVFCKFVITL